MMEFSRYIYAVNPDAFVELVDWDRNPDVDWTEAVTAAGFDPEDEDISWGVLDEPWNGHPEGAVVISGNIVEDHRFVVSREAH
jgi:hypothetical protein